MAIAKNADDYTNGRVGIFFPGNPASLTGQCVSLVKWFLQEMTSVPNPQGARGHAKDYGDQLVREGRASIVGSPQRGDLVVWKQDGGGYGHIGVVLSGNRVFEQNVGIAGSKAAVYGGVTVYASRIDPLAQSWRRGAATYYRVNTYSEGDDGVKIGNGENWYWRFNRLHHQLVRNADLPREVFNSIVGKDAWSVIESWSDHPEANKLIQLQQVGALAEKDNWPGQIYAGLDKIKELEANGSFGTAEYTKAVKEVEEALAAVKALKK